MPRSRDRAARAASGGEASEGSRVVRRRVPLRVLTAAAILVPLLAMGVVDRVVERQPSSSTPRRPRGPVASTAVSGSSTWFCAGGLSGSSTPADLRIVIANPSTDAAFGTLTLIGESGAPVTIPIIVPASGRAAFASGDYTTSAHVGALVELNRGGIAVDHRLVRGAQSSVAPCAPAASDRWFFPVGATTRDASTVLSLFNPFAEDALVDIRFATDAGGARPTALQGFVVPAGTVRSVDTGSYVRRRSSVSTTVRARVGRVVADEVVRYDGSGGPRGMSLVTGAATSARAWYFPAGRETSIVHERYEIYNVGAIDAEARVDVVVEGGTIEPFALDVPAGESVAIEPRNEARIPKDVPYSIVVSTGDARASFVAARMVDARSRMRRGIAATLGSQVAVASWVLPDAAASSRVDDRLSILNPTDTPTGVSLSTLDGRSRPLPGMAPLRIEPGGRVDVRLGDYLALVDGSVVVKASDAPIVVERTRVTVAASGAPGPRPTGGPADGGPTTTLPAVGFARIAAAIGFVQVVSTTSTTIAVSTSSTTSTVPVVTSLAPGGGSTTTTPAASIVPVPVVTPAISTIAGAPVTSATTVTASPSATPSTTPSTTRPAARTAVGPVVRAGLGTSSSMAVPLPDQP